MILSHLLQCDMFITINFSIKSNELDSSVWTAVEINNTLDSPNCLCMCFDMKHIQKQKIRSKLSFRVCSVIRKCPPQRIS